MELIVTGEAEAAERCFSPCCRYIIKGPSRTYFLPLLERSSWRTWGTAWSQCQGLNKQRSSSALRHEEGRERGEHRQEGEGKLRAVVIICRKIYRGMGVLNLPPRLKVWRPGQESAMARNVMVGEARDYQWLA